jgi:hypothetical protein
MAGRPRNDRGDEDTEAVVAVRELRAASALAQGLAGALASMVARVPAFVRARIPIAGSDLVFIHDEDAGWLRLHQTPPEGP